jgi:hypothetical protein
MKKSLQSGGAIISFEIEVKSMPFFKEFQYWTDRVPLSQTRYEASAAVATVNEI